MADYNSGNFINPDYSTPEQAAQLREYAKQLQTGAIDNTAKHWTGVLAHALMGAQSGNQTSQANQMQRQLLQQGQQGLQQAGQTNPMVAALLGQTPAPQQQPMMMPQSQNTPPSQPRMAAAPMQSADVPAGEPLRPGQQGNLGEVLSVDYDPAAIPANAKPQQFSPQGGGDLSAFYMNPSIPPELKKGVQEGLTPKVTEDVYGRPGSQTAIGGIQGRPVQGNYQPGKLVPTGITPEGGITTQTPLLPPGGGQGGGIAQQMQPLMDTAKNFSQQGAANKGTRGQIEQDVQQAYNSIPVRQTLSAMKDDIVSHGDKMVWGPTADWLNNFKRGIAQHAPGLMSPEDLKGLSSADSFDKLTAQLQSIVGRQVGGTDASLLQGMRSVPGSHNSKQGALALIDMLDQVAQQNSKFMQQSQYKIGQPGFDYLTAKNQFFEQNPITNPITKNPLRVDLTSKGGQPAAQGGGWGFK